MGQIHQIYATYCTYGSSAIERREASESKDRPLGYSARASSLTQSQQQQIYQRLRERM